MEEQDNLSDIAREIFSKPPGEPNSVQLQLDEFSNCGLQQNEIDEVIFNIIYLITYSGIKYLYGEDIDLLALTKDQFCIVKKYVKSYGYDLVVLANDLDKDPWELVNNGEVIKKYSIYFDKI